MLHSCEICSLLLKFIKLNYPPTQANGKKRKTCGPVEKSSNKRSESQLDKVYMMQKLWLVPKKMWLSPSKVQKRTFNLK